MSKPLEQKEVDNTIQDKISEKEKLILTQGIEDREHVLIGAGCAADFNAQRKALSVN